MRQSPFEPVRPLTGEMRARLREDGNYIGGTLILLVTLLNFAYTVLSLLLAAMGAISRSALTEEKLGLGGIRYLLFYLVVYTLCMGLPSLLVTRMFRRPRIGFRPTGRVSAATALSGVAIGFSGCVGANLVASYVTQILENFGISAPEAPDLTVHTPLGLVLNLVVMAVLPALLEELLFRVCVLQTLRPYGDRFAILLSAALFGLMHGGISQSVFAFLVGLVLGWLVVNTGNIWLAVLLHFVNNAVSVVLEYVGEGMPEPLQELLYTAVLFGLGLIGLVVLVVCAARRAPILQTPLHGRCPAGSCTAALWSAPLMVLATVLLLLHMLQSNLP